MAPLECSFCGKQQDEVKRLVVGPGVYICDECVTLCQAVIDESPEAEAPAPADETVASVADVAKVLDRGALVELLDRLADRERRVLDLRYGLSGKPPRTRDEVASELGLTTPEIRTIETQSLAELRAASELPPGA